MTKLDKLKRLDGILRKWIAFAMLGILLCIIVSIWMFTIGLKLTLTLTVIYIFLTLMKKECDKQIEKDGNKGEK